MDEETAFVESLKLCFDNVKRCALIFSAIFLFGDLMLTSIMAILAPGFLTFLESNNLYQLVDNPTRQSILDLIIPSLRSRRT